MNQDTIITILLGLIALGLPLATFFASTRANRRQAKAELIKAEAEEKGVDALAYDRAAKLYGDMIRTLRGEIERVSESARNLEGEVTSLRTEKSRLAEEVAALRTTNASLVSEVGYLRSEIAVLHAQRSNTE